MTRTVTIAGLLGALTAPAFAQGESSVADAPDGQYAVQRDVQGPAGMISAHLLLGINASSGAFGEPISFMPDLFYGVSNELQLGLVHDGPLGWQTRPGPGLCLTGTDHGCAHLYDNLGIDAMYALGASHVSLHTSLFFDSLDPTTIHIALGIAGKAHFSDRAALVFDPKIAIAANNRDTNDDALFIPVELEYQAAAPTVLKLLSGLSGSLSAFGDTYQVPLGVGVVHNLNRHLDLGARFSFDNLLGTHPAGVGVADARSIALLFNVRS